jgi:hypothetical protein
MVTMSTKQRRGDQVADRKLEPAEDEPKDVAEGLHAQRIGVDSLTMRREACPR